MAKLKTRHFSAAAIGGGGTALNADLVVVTARTLVVSYQLFGTVTTADLTGGVRCYQDDTNLFNVGIPVVRQQVAIAVGADVLRIDQYDVSCFDKVQIRITNNNVGALTATVVSYLDTI